MATHPETTPTAVTPAVGFCIEIPYSPAPRVSIIVPVAGGTKLLLACLQSIARHAPRDIAFETIVVLNNTTSARAMELGKHLIGVTLINTPANLGLAGSGNRARSVARGELLILLHDDAEIEAGWMEALVLAADQNADAGAVGSKVLNLDGTLQLAGAILWNNALTSVPWAGAAPPPAAFDRCRAVDYCGTSSLLIRRATWDAMGGLDEQFYPAYYVDVDAAMGVRALGQCVLLAPDSRIRHHRGASLGHRYRHFVGVKNGQRFRAKWASALMAQDPPDPTSEEAISHALARSEKVRGSGPFIAPDTPTLRHAGEGEDAREMRHLLVERSLWRDFAASLEQTIDTTQPTPAAPPPAPEPPKPASYAIRYTYFGKE